MPHLWIRWGESTSLHHCFLGKYEYIHLPIGLKYSPGNAKAVIDNILLGSDATDVCINDAGAFSSLENDLLIPFTNLSAVAVTTTHLTCINSHDKSFCMELISSMCTSMMLTHKLHRLEIPPWTYWLDTPASQCQWFQIPHIVDELTTDCLAWLMAHSLVIW